MIKEKQQEKKQLILEYFSDVPIYRYAAMYAGINEDTLASWRKADPDFSERLEEEKSKWVRKKVLELKADWALERLEREIFAPPKQESIVTTVDPVMILLQKFGVMEAIEGERKAPESIQDSSQSGT